MIEYTVKVYETRTEWYQNGELHREDGPAYECSDGYKVWYLNDERHREDGPAIEYSNGDKAWFLHGKRYSEEEFLKKTQPVKELSVKEIEKLLGYSIKITK